MSKYSRIIDEFADNIAEETKKELERRGLPDISVNRIFGYYTLLTIARGENPSAENETMIFALKLNLIKEMRRFMDSDYRS